MGCKLHFDSFVFKHDKPCFMYFKKLEVRKKYHVNSIAGVTEVTEVAKRSVLNRLYAMSMKLSSLFIRHGYFSSPLHVKKACSTGYVCLYRIK